MESEEEKNDVKEELSKMTFEELQKLKAKIGTKVYNEAVFGSKEIPLQEFKRVNKNRPREISSKKQEPFKLKSMSKTEVRDPRFDSLCGEFDSRQFQKSYRFLDKVRQKEKIQLINQLKDEEDPLERKKIKAVLQRLKNKELERLKKIKKDEKAKEEREDKIRLLNEGKKPHFRSKLENKVVGLVEQYDELKKKGKLQKHIEKHRKKITQKERKMGMYD